MSQLGIIGCGTMGSAIALSLKCKVLVYDSLAEQLKKLEGQQHITIASSLEELLAQSDTIILAVKPQILPSLYSTLRSAKGEKRWISIAAGISLAQLSEGLQSKEIVRLMPNIAAAKRASVTALAATEKCSSFLIRDANEIASSFGAVFALDEKLFSAFIGISGSAIAYMLQFVHALSMGGVAEGIAYPLAKEIVTQTLVSTTAMLADEKAHPMELASSVCSAGGTTIEGVAALANGAFEATVIDAVRAASEKSRIMEAEALDHRKNEDKE
ncbi:MAG: pyrroline-5-carboxylate reductase [Sphaerochaeta sp.]